MPFDVDEFIKNRLKEVNEIYKDKEIWKEVLTRGFADHATDYFKWLRPRERKFMKSLWDAFFDYNENPGDMFEKYRNKGYCWHFGDNDVGKDKIDDFRPTEIEIHEIPSLFELIDYTLEITECAYVDNFSTSCCVAIWRPGEKERIVSEEVKKHRMLNIPVFHSAMDPYPHRRGIIIYKEVVKKIGVKFFKKRYPRFFNPEVSHNPGEKFISNGERKMAFQFQRNTLGKKKIKWDDFKKYPVVNNLIHIPDKIELS
ncbi:MAG: hypothetical protein NTY10_01485 [Candidatus Omnitrophica bacterium]|nr:hypothetical protein [Candidatus Omnitrophota bacterium]